MSNSILFGTVLPHLLLANYDIRTNQTMLGHTDKEEVSAIIIEDLEEIELFEKLTGDIKKALKNLDSASAEAIYSNSRGEDYYPGRESSYYSWDDFKTPIEYKEVILTPEKKWSYSKQ